MAWFGDGLSSLSSLKGQITSFTKEVLSEGIVEETDERTRQLNEANERCVQLQEILNTKDSEISLLRRQNCELQKTVVELNAKPRYSNDSTSLDDDGGGGFFWDPPPIRNREALNNPDKSGILQERLSQASLRIRELEDELKLFKTNDKKDEMNDGNRKAELLRAKQDMVNRIIQIGEKSRDAERNLKKLTLDESVLINDFRAAVSKLDSHEQSCMIRCALKALDVNRDDSSSIDGVEKSDVDEKRGKYDRPRLESISLDSHIEDIECHNGMEEKNNASVRMENEQLRKKIKELQQENEFLSTSLDELDKEHSQSLDTILVVKDQLSKKHESLQKAYEQLYVECNEAQTKLQLLESKPSTGVEANNNSISKKSAPVESEEVIKEEKEVQTDHKKISNENKDIQTDTDETTSKSENDEWNLDVARLRVNDILKNSRIDVENGETLFESLARNYVDANWKKEMLERKLTEVSRDLKETSEMRDSLHMECDDLQSNIESLLVQIEYLKSNLPSIPEASEERVASLETETESMGEEIKRLQTEHEALKVKHFALIETTNVSEGSRKNRENLEAEVRNTNEQLEIVKRNLDGASKNSANNENMMEDLNRRLHASLEENDRLKKRIDALKIADESAREKIRAAVEKCSSMEKTVEIVEKLRKDVEEATRELNDSRLTCERLRNDVATAVEAKNELERDVSSISDEKDRLEAELLVLRENETKKTDSDLLKNLRELLDSANRERDDLEYDILNMRRELDGALDELETAKNEASKLGLDNDKLAKENCELLEQLESSHDDSMERIELLQTEMSLLTQEHSSVKHDAAVRDSELSKVRNELSDALQQRNRSDEELAATIAKYETLNRDFTELEEAERRAREEEAKRVKYLEDRLEVESEKRQRLETELEELENLRRSEDESKMLQDRCESLKTVEIEEKCRKTELRCRELESVIENLQTSRNESEISKENDEKIIAELKDSRDKLETSLESAKENAAMARETIESLSRLVKEKDEEIERLKNEISANADKKNSDEENATTTLKAEREELVRLVQEKHNTSLQYYAEIQRLAVLLTEQGANLQQTIAERDEKISKLAEKEAEIHWAQNELQVVRQRLKSLEESHNYGETCGVVEHSVKIAQTAMLNEKCVALEAALIQEQSSNRIMQNQLSESQSRESNAAKELERLRTHLVEMEASYTEEAIVAEENRKQLEAKLLQAEEKMQNTSTVYTSASIRANQQVETLQQQMSLIVQQRDEIQNKLSAAEDKVLSHTASLTNLQIVLEQFQRDKENDIRAATEKIRQQLNMSYKEQEDLRNEIVNLRTQLSEAQECFRAASRLSEELDKKSERIRELNQEVARLTELVDTADERIQEARNSEEGKVDKNLVKNLLIGFLSSSTTDKSSVLRVFATILEFDATERERAGLNHPSANGGWFSGLLGSGSANPTKDQEASLSAAFVRFLESESKPKPQLPALTISNSPLGRPGHSRQHSSSSTQSGLLLSNVTLPSFPDFVPSRNTGSILKEVLKDS